MGRAQLAPQHNTTRRNQMIFKLQIEIGNDDMETYGHIAEALQSVADDMRGYGIYSATKILDNPISISDINGNVVGDWRVTQ